MVNRLSKKTVASGIVLVVIIGLSLAYFLTDGFIFPIQIKINQLSINRDHTTYYGQVYQQVGSYNYVFEYFPTFTDNFGRTTNGNLTIQRTDIQTATGFPLTTGVSQNYQGVTFILTQVKFDYVIVSVKPTS